MQTSIGRSFLWIVLAAVLALPLAGCSGNSAQGASPASLKEERSQALIVARQQMELIPPPTKSRYLAIHDLDSWENPYLTVQGGMVTLHVLLADANTSDLGRGGMLRPVSARRNNLDVRISDLPSALNAIPPSAWPYGRVVAVEEAHKVPASAEPQVRRNVETVLKTLGDLGVVAYDWNDSSRN
ncbi:MAG TPA: hypothetical protein VL495_06640 [Edaphobacter sp.]|jgi:hypothetical protein|nr:hypothetical protein [Edaphobacter sp.]